MRTGADQRAIPWLCAARLLLLAPALVPETGAQQKTLVVTGFTNSLGINFLLMASDAAAKIISGPRDVERLLIFDWAQVARQRPAWTEKWNRALR